jgi:hypothetical protein
MSSPVLGLEKPKQEDPMARRPQQDVTLTPELHDQLTAMVRSVPCRKLTRRAPSWLMAAEA